MLNIVGAGITFFFTLITIRSQSRFVISFFSKFQMEIGIGSRLCCFCCICNLHRMLENKMQERFLHTTRAIAYIYNIHTRVTLKIASAIRIIYSI